MITHRSDIVLLNLMDSYTKENEPIEVDFRKLVSWIPYGERATHLIHPYPGKLLSHIPHFFLANNILTEPGDVVLDPFCGSGTVLLEAVLLERNGLGVDSNPLACLISRVKTTRIDLILLRKFIDVLGREIPHTPRIPPADVINLQYWFYPEVIEKLQCILQGIETIQDSVIRDYFFVCFSNFVRRVSLADPRISVPVKLKIDRFPENHWLRKKVIQRFQWLNNINIVEEFFKVVESNFVRISKLNEIFKKNVIAEILQANAKDLSFCNNVLENRIQKIEDASVQLIITSPPYAGAQKYIRATSLNLGWTNLCSVKELRTLEGTTIGREHFPKRFYESQILTGLKLADEFIESIRKTNPLRAHIAGTYLLEMKDSLKEMYRVLKPNGYLVIVIGNNFICGKTFKTSEYLQILAEEVGFHLLLKLVDTIHSRGMMTKRNRTASLITREWILVFQKRSY